VCGGNAVHPLPKYNFRSARRWPERYPSIASHEDEIDRFNNCLRKNDSPCKRCRKLSWRLRAASTMDPRVEPEGDNWAVSPHHRETTQPLYHLSCLDLIRASMAVPVALSNA